ncbi:MAG: SUMF1/EgtB/PvdO family nonheme iron enzyme, partial [Deltaproteobacteria bacterium]
WVKRLHPALVVPDIWNKIMLPIIAQAGQNDLVRQMFFADPFHEILVNTKPNGLVDDNAPDAWVNIQTTFGTSRMYAYEASRPDADGTTAGTMAHRPCSAAGRLPWVNVTAPQAAAACVAIGARLCYENEWQGGCEGNAVPTCTYAYGAMCTTYQPNTCNGNDYDSDPARPGDQDSVYPTGHFGQCYMQWGSDTGARLFDMSGNVKEWTAPRAAGINPLRGGSYNNPQAGLACSYNFTLADDAFLFSNVGFRCCQDVP